MPATPDIPVPSNDAGLSDRDARAYAQAGVGAQDALAWREAGIGPYEAGEFLRSGADVEAATAWRARVPTVSGGLLARWVQAHQDPEQAFDRFRARKVREESRATTDHRRSQLRAESGDARKMLCDELLAELKAYADASTLRVTVGEVAKLAGRDDPSIVSHWRSGRRSGAGRPLPFPEPVTGGRSPLFNAGEILAWLKEQDLLLPGPPPPSWWWLQSVRALADAVSLPDSDDADEQRPKLRRLRAFVAALFTLAAELTDRGDAPSTERLPDTCAGLRRLAQATASALPSHLESLKEVLVPGLSAVEVDDEVLAVAVRGLQCALVDGSHGSTRAELLDDALDTLGELSPDTSTTHPTLARLIKRIATVDPEASIVDPACGEAELLVRLADGNHRGRVVGVDNDPDATVVARARLAAHGIDAEIIEADSLQPDLVDRVGQFDLVVLDPPAGKRRTGTAVWLPRALDLLKPQGTALVALPQNAVGPKSIVAESFRHGAVSAVVLLPSGVRRDSRDTQALCVLSDYGSRHDEILVVDLTGHPLETGRVKAPTSSQPTSSERRRQERSKPYEIAAAITRKWLATGVLAEDPSIPTNVVPSIKALRDGISKVEAPPLPNDVDAALEMLKRAVEAHPDVLEHPAYREALRILEKAPREPTPRARRPGRSP